MESVKISKGYNLTYADKYDVAAYPAVLRDVLIAVRMAKAKGFRSTLRHTRIVALGRLHHRLVDARREALLPKPLAGETALDGMTLRPAVDEEVRAAKNCSAMPSKTFQWAISAAGINPAHYHFVDVGSGWGYATLLATEYPFRAVTGIELAEELHEHAVVNIAWAQQKHTVVSGSVEVLNQSALEYALPNGPVLLLLNNPFEETVMQRFIERVDQSYRANPRSIVVIYSNPHFPKLFERAGVRQLQLSGLSALLLRMFSPFLVSVFAWGGP